MQIALTGLSVQLNVEEEEKRLMQHLWPVSRREPQEGVVGLALWSSG